MEFLQNGCRHVRKHTVEDESWTKSWTKTPKKTLLSLKWKSFWKELLISRLYFLICQIINHIQFQRPRFNPIAFQCLIYWECSKLMEYQLVQMFFLSEPFTKEGFQMTKKAVVNTGTSCPSVWCLCIVLGCREFCMVSDNNMLHNNIMYVYHAIQTQHTIFMFCRGPLE